MPFALRYAEKRVNRAVSCALSHRVYVVARTRVLLPRSRKVPVCDILLCLETPLIPYQAGNNDRVREELLCHHAVRHEDIERYGD
jgi:hypothetical protein